MIQRKANDVCESERRRDAAHATLEARRHAIVRRGRRALLTVLLDRGTASVDDVRGSVDLPSDIDPVCFGAVPRSLARAGIIHRAGFVATSRPDAHARPVSIWRLVDRDAALQWLTEHPEIPEPPPSQEKAQRLLPLGEGAE